MPIVLFTFNRPHLSELVLKAIVRWEPDAKVFVFIDGPRSNVQSDFQLVEKNVQVVNGFKNRLNLEVVIRAENLGLKTSILTGLDEVFSEFDCAVILEDDCLPSEAFFKFCRSGLAKYRNDFEVGSIAGYNSASSRAERDWSYFAPHPQIWGWATWADRWKEFRNFNFDSSAPENIKNLRKKFDSKLSWWQFQWLLRANASLNTWDVDFSIYFRMSNKLCLLPGGNLIKNLGFGDFATHTTIRWPSLEIDFEEPTLDHTFPTEVIVRRNLHSAQTFRKVKRSIAAYASEPKILVQNLISITKRLRSVLKSQSPN